MCDEATEDVSGVCPFCGAVVGYDDWIHPGYDELMECPECGTWASVEEVYG